MGFSEKIKLEVRKRAFFRCCVCHKPFVEVHHILPISERGSNRYENAAPLCASCHDLFGANPDKRRRIKQMRENWYEQMDKLRLNLKRDTDLQSLYPIQEEPNNINSLKGKKIVLYHIVFKNEGFEESARSIYNLVKESQQRFPYHDRILFLDIEGHRNDDGGFDWDMFELLRFFILEFLMPYLSKAFTPLVDVENKLMQKNADMDLIIFNSDDKIVNIAKQKEVDKLEIDIHPKSQFRDKKKEI